MRLALISDIHSNLEALTNAFEWVDNNDIDQTYCLGDVVGYGADPNPCCDILRERGVASLLGNHDAAVIGVMDTDYYYPAARDAIYWTREQLSKENFRWLYGLPYTLVFESIGLYHSAPLRPSGFFYVVQTRDAGAHTAIFDQLPDWNFVGHSHLTHAYALTREDAVDVTGQALTAAPDTKHIINVGSVGQPRDRDSRLCFGVYDTEAQSFEYIRVAYDIPTAARKIEHAGLDSQFATRLFAGH